MRSVRTAQPATMGPGSSLRRLRIVLDELAGTWLEDVAIQGGLCVRRGQGLVGVPAIHSQWRSLDG
jgi:hypothetical protein